MTYGNWRHMSSLDTDLVVLGIVLIAGGWRCHVGYWNRHLRFVHDTEIVEIRREDFWKWERV